MDPRRIRDALASFVPARVLEPAFAWAVTAGYAAKFRGLEMIRANERLRGIHRGERCFVLGNGPSLGSHDLGKLRGEFVFTVNSFVEHAEELGVRPSCHTLLDPFFFDEANDGLRTLKKVAALGPETLTIFPLHFKPVIDRHVSSPSYVLMAGELAGNRNADLARPIPSMYSVTNIALLAALYMGFEDIYLLGCEMDLLSRVVGVQPLRIRESHYYSDVESIADWGALGFDYSRYAASVLRMFEGFRFAADVCAPGQTIRNATPGGLLDTFERIDYDAIF